MCCFVFSEHGKQPALCQLGRQFRERRGKVISVTRNTANPLRAHADLSLLVSAHDDAPHIEPLLYSPRAARLDLLSCCSASGSREQEARLTGNLERIQRLASHEAATADAPRLHA